MKKISIGCCCYNEEGNIYKTYSQVTEIMQGLQQYDYEIVFSDNASKDKTIDIIRKICKNDKKVKAIINSTNFGVHNSGINLMQHCSGDAIVIIPCDLQEPLELIKEFIKEWESGYEVVLGQKLESEENKLKYFLRSIYYKIIDMFSEYQQMKQVTGFGLYDRTMIDYYLKSAKQDTHLILRHFVAEFGFKTKLIPYKQKKREWGKTSYNLSRSLSFAITSLCNTSIKPLRIVTLLGLFSSLISFIVGMFYFVYKLVTWRSFEVGIAPLVIGLFFISSVQLFSIGMLGEYIGIMIRRITIKPTVIERELINFNQSE